MLTIFGIGKVEAVTRGGVVMSHSYPSDISREQFARILPTMESGPADGPSPAAWTCTTSSVGCCIP